MFTDTHTHHSPFSFDSTQTLDELVNSAVAAGLSGLMLTDHFDMDFPTLGNMSYTFDLDKGRTEWLGFRKTKDSCAGPLIHYGIEIGYQPQFRSICRELCESDRFDGAILSLHLLNGLDPFDNSSMFSRGKISVYTAYLEALADMMRAIPGPAIIGHFDYIARYAPIVEPAFIYAEMPNAFDRFFEAIIDSGKCLEFNVQSLLRINRRRQTTGLSGASTSNRSQLPSFQLPDPELFQRYAALGGRMVSLGSDAHSSGQCGQWFPESAEFLKKCGIQDLTHFVHGKPCLTPITAL
jgi:histidinol-phosphatase (PHP family)